MGSKQFKIDNSNAKNVNNEEFADDTPQLGSLQYLILLPTILPHLLLAIYSLHKKYFKSEYLRQANDLQKF